MFSMEHMTRENILSFANEQCRVATLFRSATLPATRLALYDKMSDEELRQEYAAYSLQIWAHARLYLLVRKPTDSVFGERHVVTLVPVKKPTPITPEKLKQAVENIENECKRRKVEHSERTEFPTAMDCLATLAVVLL